MVILTKSETGQTEESASAEEISSAIQASKTDILLNAPIGKTLAKLSAPNIIAMIVMTFTTIAEGIFAGILGIPALAALAIVFPFVMLTQMLSAGAIGGAISASVARALGAGDVTRAEKLILHAVIIGVLAGLTFAFLYYLIGIPVFRLLGASDATLVAATEYANIFFPGAILIWVCHCLFSVIKATGNMVFPATVLLCAFLATSLLSGAFALGWGPVPALGMAGLAVGLIVSFGTAALFTFIWMASGKAELNLLNAFTKPQGSLFWDILRVGLPASLSAFQSVFTIVVMVGIVGLFGKEALAGYGLGARLEFMTLPIIFGIGTAMTAMIGTNMGAAQFERAKAIAWHGSIGAGIIVGTIGLVVAIYPDLWLGMFLTPENQGALEAGRMYLQYVAPFYFLYATGMALFFASQGAGKLMWPVIAGLLRMVIAVSGGLLATQIFGLGQESVYVAIAMGMTVFGIVTFYAVGKSSWETK